MSQLLKAYRLFLKSWRAKNTVTVVGQDQFGNTYYEEQRENHYRKIHRYYRQTNYDEDEPLNGLTPAPPLWDAWLKFKRLDPPSSEEIQQSIDYFEKNQKIMSEKPSTENKLPEKLNEKKIKPFPRLPYRQTGS